MPRKSESRSNPQTKLRPLNHPFFRGLRFVFDFQRSQANPLGQPNTQPSARPSGTVVAVTKGRANFGVRTAAETVEKSTAKEGNGGWRETRRAGRKERDARVAAEGARVRQWSTLTTNYTIVGRLTMGQFLRAAGEQTE